MTVRSVRSVRKRGRKCGSDQSGSHTELRHCLLLSVPATSQGEVSYSIPTDADRSGVSRLFPPFATSIPIFLSRRSFKDDFISSAAPAPSDKMPFETRAGGSRGSGNTDIVSFYQEFTAGPESITHRASGRKDRRVSADKPGTRPSADAHARQTAYSHANMPRAHLRKSKHTRSCACGFGKQREIKGSDDGGRRGEKEKKKVLG